MKKFPSQQHLTFRTSFKKIVLGRVHVFTAGSIASSSFLVKSGTTLDIGYNAGTLTNAMTFESGAILSNRGSALAISTVL